MSALPYQLDEEVEKAAKVAAQWPKRCACGRMYCNEPTPSLSAFSWSALPSRGRWSDSFAEHEMRDCACGSTLMVVVSIHDLGEE